jgi:hypothetical protein
MGTTTYSAGDCIDIATIRCIKWKSSATATAQDVDCIYIGSNLIFDANTFTIAAADTKDESDGGSSYYGDSASGRSTGANPTHLTKYCWEGGRTPGKFMNNQTCDWLYSTRHVPLPDGLDGATKATVSVDWGDPDYAGNTFWSTMTGNTITWPKKDLANFTKSQSSVSNKWLMTSYTGGPSNTCTDCVLDRCSHIPCMHYNPFLHTSDGTSGHPCRSAAGGHHVRWNMLIYGDSSVTNSGAPGKTFAGDTTTSTGASTGRTVTAGGWAVRAGFRISPGGAAYANYNQGCTKTDRTYRTNGPWILMWPHYDPENNEAVITTLVSGCYNHGGYYDRVFGPLVPMVAGRKITVIKGGRNTDGPGLAGAQGWDVTA